ncbi:MAG: 4a-hydroxytetrahydrobiopterin dehydratase [Microcoleus sp. PH2017_10_PVI_O_A]|uniref:4a-hydroxytetrahydrobiopterin dehydratase n=1 Tax=unclassified Microcoleus TaxID=2642155 RepID=UPI001D452FB8|nr:MULTISPECIES: 4a-hydroxytetrahydrobiopterin dehydratase [unclassified Microcoleus]TAE74919.1 MAG: 4a-hydroxytetrahydrobiopterin dehydratase [Oscillatoriales cyanobacterium]MCC3409573.1 4a-hydroxytetrahydrobiopterin dehydratase [Microcoleus sp. PH2017_10_PVI_O_A]MCC3463832.1 4a-hydroxytetrahydrobiopterin dehydratase [Microcoleus sp. PH2017_11_PCY_U_A]MCC3482184.1 4a-hydroxytetrahydrobiopterin dehydratase [Microcoleus sp. PH2017_12_PCY_D_A]MCC3532023.1 4a-hydroxytetrahydrobiopterin dehydratas
MADLLSDSEIKERASLLSGPTVEGRKLRCTRSFKDFIGAIAFVNKLVAPSEAAGHHPDIEISYNKVTVNLTTHDAGGLTEKDLALAQEISALN